MKKIFSSLVLGVVLAVMVMPLVALAQDKLPEGCTMRYNVGIAECNSFGEGVVCNPNVSANACPGICCLMNTIMTITNWMFYILMLVVTLMIIYGGFVLLTAQGAPDKVGKGRGIITFAIIGLAVALLAKIIPSVVRFIMGV